jgi:hypothetical protein
VVNFDATATSGAATQAKYVLTFGAVTPAAGGTISIHLPGVGDIEVTVVDSAALNAGANLIAIAAALVDSGKLPGHPDWSATNDGGGVFTLTHIGGTTAFPGFSAPTLSLGTATYSGSTTLMTTAGSADFTYTTLGEDVLDFTSYGAKWLGAAVLADTTHAPSDGASAGWDVALPGLNGVAVHESAVSVVLDSVTRDTDKLHAGDRYITLTHDTDTGHVSTRYNVELWNIKGTVLDARAAAGTGDVEDDPLGVIGYIDVGRLIEGTLTADSVLGNIIY